MAQFACPEPAAALAIDHSATTPRQETADDRRSLRAGGPLPPGYTTPGGTTDRGRQDRLPIIHQLRQDGVSWPAQALAAQGGVVVPAILRLEWSTDMVHSVPTRPPWLDRKALQDKGF